MPTSPTGIDHDGDGDYDQFDEAHQEIIDHPEIALGQAAEERGEILRQNILWEFMEDIGELFDGNPNNDSFMDGGNGSGTQTPLPGSGGGVPVYWEFDSVTYSFWNGNFTIIGGGGPGGGGGGDGMLGN
jgi:hypothetical protein